MALLDEKATHGTATQDRLRAIGHRLATFASAADLLAALGGGQRFDLLLLASQDETTHKNLRAACEVLGMAILVIPHGEPWKGLPSWNEELARRKRAVLRRRDSPVWDARSGEMVRGAYRFLDASGTVLLRGHEIHLPPRPFTFASVLFRNIDIVLTREWLWNSIWKAPPERTAGRVIDVCAANVRKKLVLHAENGFVLRCVYRVGYKLVAVAPGQGSPADEPDTHWHQQS